MKFKHLCLECEKADMARATQDVTVRKGQFSELVRHVYGWHCPNCGNIEFLGKGDGQRVSDAFDRVFTQDREAQAAMIRGTRKKLKLTQLQAANIFGGGKSAFSEYEHGKTQPPKAMLALLRLLGNHPELLPEVMAAA
jgi:HTH-type transcriptional regulator/antitoxin MqsA